MTKYFALAGVAGLLLFAPGRADAASCCCDQKAATHDMKAMADMKSGMHDRKAGCCDMPCCAEKAAAPAEPSAIDVLMAVASDVTTELPPN
jgi:hypothetical protein